MKVLSSALLALVTVSGSAFASVSFKAPRDTKALIVDTNIKTGDVMVFAILLDDSSKLIRQTTTSEINEPSVTMAGMVRQNDYQLQTDNDQSAVIGGRRGFYKRDEVHIQQGYEVDPSYSSSHQHFNQNSGNFEQASPDYVVPVAPGYGPGYGPGPGFGPGPGYGPGPGFDQGIPLRRR